MASFNINSTNNKLAKYLSNLNADQIFKRYFVKKSSTASQDILADVNVVLNEKFAESDNYKYGFVTSILGVNFNYFLTHIKSRIPAFIDGTGYKINIPQVIKDLDTILKENKLITTKIALNKQEPSEDAVLIADFIVTDLMLKSLEHFLENNSTID